MAIVPIKRVVVAGPDGSKKQAIIAALEGEVCNKLPTQELWYGRHSIAIPESYVDNRWLNKSIVMIVQNQARELLLLMDARNLKELYHPGFAAVFNLPTMGLITHLDELDGSKKKAALDFCMRVFQSAGVSKIFVYQG